MKKLIVALIILLMTVGSTVANADVIRWDASSGDVNGYRIYWGTEAGVYPYNTDVGNVTEIGTEGQAGVLEDYFQLNPGTWNFVVRAYNDVGESGDSNIASLTIAEPPVVEDNFPIKIVLPATTTITITND